VKTRFQSLLFTFNLCRYSLDACPTTTIASGLSSASFVCTYYGKSGVSGLSGVGAWDVQYYDKLSAANKLSSIAMMGPCYPVFASYTPILNR
jgi:choline transporter-like protein 2/4/5